jgi:hypothetical protein
MAFGDRVAPSIDVDVFKRRPAPRTKTFARLIYASQCLSENKLSLLSRLATPLLNSLNPLPFSPSFLNLGKILGVDQ